MTYAQNIAELGYALIEDAVSTALCNDVIDVISEDIVNDSKRGGQRNALQKWEVVRELATASPLYDYVSGVLGSDCFAVRAIIFDKTPSTNWKVPWHQDVAIPIKSRSEAAGFGPWSTKAGVPHVKPPASVLESMLTARLHLDNCGPSDGPLRVIPGSHRAGLVDEANVSEIVSNGNQKNVCLAQGGLLLMRPLLLHASSAAAEPRHRRVLHIEYACTELPASLDWYERHLRKDV